MSRSGAAVVMILDLPYPDDVRVRKEAEALAAAGYAVHLLCLGGDGRPEREVLGPLTVHRRVVPAAGVTGLWRRNRFKLTFRHPQWEAQMARLLAEVGAGVLHVHDLPLAGPALAVRKRFPGLRVVLDLHENFPAGLQEWRRQQHGVKAALLGVVEGYARWNRYEGRAVHAADRVIAVVPEMAARLGRVHGLDPARVVVVSNTEPESFLGGDIPPSPPPPGPDNPFTLLYIGAFGSHRGLETAVAAMPLLAGRDGADAGMGDGAGQGVPIRLRLVGQGAPWQEAGLRRAIQQQGAEPWVEQRGWVPAEHVPREMLAAHLGLVPHARNEHTEHTIPHKLFQYLLCARPVLVSDCHPLARVVTESGAGLVFPAGDAAGFAAAARRLAEDGALYARLAAAARAAVTAGGPFSHAHDRAALVTLYRALLPAPKR